MTLDFKRIESNYSNVKALRFLIRLHNFEKIFNFDYLD